MRLAWTSDIHLDHCSPGQKRALYQDIQAAHADMLLISGDISSARWLEQDLDALQQATGLQIAFVLGNHDYWGSSIARVEDSLRKRQSPAFCWLDDYTKPITIAPNLRLVGRSGWYDFRTGDGPATRSRLNDQYLIDELHDPTGPPVAAAQRLADRGSRDLEQMLIPPFPATTIVLTHVPPYRDACRHRGRPTGDSFLPYYCNYGLGRTLTRAAKGLAEDQSILVLAGHTHGEADYSLPLVRGSLRVRVGEAAYERPRVHEVFEFPERG